MKKKTTQKNKTNQLLEEILQELKKSNSTGKIKVYPGAGSGGSPQHYSIPDLTNYTRCYKCGGNYSGFGIHGC